MKVICISGKAQSGKDTFAAALAEGFKKRDKRVLTVHFADFLKFFCKQYLGWNGEKDEYGRALLQRMGTDVFRKNYHDCWVDIMIGLLRGCKSEYDYVLIPDTRFPNEIDKLVAFAKRKGDFAEGVTAIRIERPDFDNGLTTAQKSHPSETSLDDYPFPHHYCNIGGVSMLKREADQWAEYIINDHSFFNRK